ncbi:MAG: insulinase family protein [Flavobacteriales bacterium]|nr:insulinase family protein [Flavobacteriales bacterium]
MNARTIHAGLCLGGLILPLLMNAQLDRSHPPAPGPTPKVSLGEHTTFKLPNGFQVIVVENHKLPLVGVQVRFDIPPITQGQAVGYIDMMGDLLAAGTAKRDKATLDADVDRMGATFFTNSEGAYASGLKRHLPELLDLLTEVVTSPTFPEAEIEKARKREMSSVQQRKDDASAIADVVGRSVTFGRGHPYGEVVTATSLSRISVKQLNAYHHTFFRPEKGYLVFVGDITEKEVRALLKGELSKWKPDAVRSTLNENGMEHIEGLGDVRYLDKPAVPRGARRVLIVDRPGAGQSVIRVSFPLNLQPKDERALSAQVMNTILGGGVFNARLMQNLREDKGWTYGIYSTMESDRFNGHFHITANVGTDVTDSAIVETLKEMELIRAKGVTAEELDLAKRYMAGSFARSLEDPRTIARFELNKHLNGLADDHYATYLKRLDAVTIADVQAAAEAFIYPDNAVILVVGDKKKLMSKLGSFSWSTGQGVTELDHNGAFWVEEFEPVPGLTAEQVIEDHLKAIGGREAIARIKNMRMELTTEMNGRPVTVVQWYGPDGQFKSVTKADDLLMQEDVFDGTRGVRLSSAGDREIEDMELGELMFNGHAIPELHYPQTTERVILSGRINIGGKPMHKLFIQLNTGGTVGDYYDAKTGLKQQRVDRKIADGRTWTITTEYGNYQAAGGVLFPRTIVQTGGPGGDLTLTVTAIDVNLDLKPTFFAITLPPPVVPVIIPSSEEQPSMDITPAED